MSQRVDLDTVTMPDDAKPQQVQDLYDRYAKTYDEDINPDTSYPALRSITNSFLEIVGESADKNMRIIDLAAGTGLVAVELQKHGFANIDGLDLSPEMLKKAKEKNAYKHYICEALNEKRLDIPTGTYDAALIVGAVTSGYIKATAFDEILRLVKPGGYIAFSVRHDVFDRDSEFGYPTKFQQFVNDGKWKEVKKYVADYVLGSIDVLKKCYVLCYKVLKSE